MHDATATANDLGVEFAPDAWFHDPHGFRSENRPRCCEVIACIRVSLEAIPEWTEEDARELARQVLRGMKGLGRPC